MKVAIVCPYAWDRFGGVQSHVRALARALEARGHTIGILAPQSSGQVAESPVGVTLVGRALSVPANGSMAPVAFGPLAAAGIRRALEVLEPQVVHVHEPLIPSLSLLALWNAEAPTVGTFHAAAESSFGYRASRPVLARAASRLTVRTAVSDAARGLVSRYFPGEYELTPNGVEVERFADAEPMDLGPGKRILFLGRLEKRKGLDVLIEAMTFLRDLDVRLVVAGGGPEERFSRSFARRLGIEATFIGRLSEDDLPRAFRATDVYCAPGLGGESFGIVLAEAMAAGAPVVCSDLPAFRSVAGDAALLVPPDEPAALARGLRRALTQPEVIREMGDRGREVAQRFDWSRLAAGVEDIYEQALTRR